MRISLPAKWHREALGELSSVWNRWSLAWQFAVCALLVLVPAMAAIGLWVSDRIQEGVANSAGSSAALYMENFVEPLVQELATQDHISADKIIRLSKLLDETSLGQNVLTFKIWAPDGLVVASNRLDLIGQRFAPGERLRRAWGGQVAAEFNKLHDAENAFEASASMPLLEVYVPLRARGSERVIAVGEFYEKAHDLSTALDTARLWSWLVVGGVTFSMFAALFGIVRRGSRTIDVQRQALEGRVDELTGLLAENRRLRLRVNEASARSSESSENYLRRLGADLHDGPAQLISLALLRLDEPQSARTGGAGNGGKPPLPAAGERAGVREVLHHALKDIRNLAAGLALPEIEPMSLAEAVALAVRRHEDLTRTRVAVDIGALPPIKSQGLKLCTYRFVQEALSNAFKHAEGLGQTVTLNAKDGDIEIEVSDRGPGMDVGDGMAGAGLGLQGLRNRIESLGGVLEIETAAGKGTRLTALLPYHNGEVASAKL